MKGRGAGGGLAHEVWFWQVRQSLDRESCRFLVPVSRDQSKNPKKATAMEVSHSTPNEKTAEQKRVANLTRRNQRLCKKIGAHKLALEAAEQQIRDAKSRIKELESEVDAAMRIQLSEARAEQTPVTPLADPNVFGHRYAASMIALCVNLAKATSLRAASKSLKIVFDALNLSAEIPDRETITRWAKRLGVDKLKQNQQIDRWIKHKDLIWIVDHSNQIGTQKVLVVLAIPASQLPPEGETLSLNSLEVLLVEPGDSWSRDDMREAYRKLSKLAGRPRFVLCDGAVELRETVDVLGDDNHEVIVLRDLKHFAANRFESLIGRSERFKEFSAQIGRTRCRIQQTELAHLNPPALKTKSRFMNIEAVISWALMVLGVLADPTAQAAGVRDVEKLRERLCWLEAYRDEIASWNRCCEAISLSLSWVNTHGLTRQSGDELQLCLEQMRKETCDLSNRLSEKIVEHVRQSGNRLREGERSWLSSETLESVFGLFKRREGQQSRSGFTGLIATLPTLLQHWTAAEVRAGLQRTSTKEAKEWVSEKVGPTLWAKRTKAFKHFGVKKSRFANNT